MERAFLVNIGNTHANAAMWDAASGVATLQTLATAEVLASDFDWGSISPPADIPWVAACVVPAVRERVETGAHGPVVWVDGGTALGLDLSAVDAATVGADRLANAVTAVNELALPAVVIDCGTAVNTVVVAPPARFLGGVIMPGRALARRALAEGTAQLPRLELAGYDAPQGIGVDTAAAIAAGVDLGLLGGLVKVLQETRTALGSEALSVIAVGGDRRFFAANVDGIDEGPDDFTLRGLGYIAGGL